MIERMTAREAYVKTVFHPMSLETPSIEGMDAMGPPMRKATAALGDIPKLIIAFVRKTSTSVGV